MSGVESAEREDFDECEAGVGRATGFGFRTSAKPGSLSLRENACPERDLPPAV
jgi:hypothetical protein